METDAELANRAETICKIYGAIIMALGERKVDVLLKDRRTPNAPIFEIAKRTGVLLLVRAICPNMPKPPCWPSA